MTRTVPADRPRKLAARAGWTTGEWILLVRCAAHLHRAYPVSSGSARSAGGTCASITGSKPFVPKPALTTTPTASAPAATAKSGISGRR